MPVSGLVASCWRVLSSMARRTPVFHLIGVGVLCCSGCADGSRAVRDGGITTDTDTDSNGVACKDLTTTTDDDGNRLVVVIADAAQNYSFESTLSAETIPVRSASNLHFDWSEVTTDMLGRDFDPVSSVDMMEVLLWQYDKDDLLRDINDDNLDRGKLQAIAYLDTGNTMSSGDSLDLLSPGGDLLSEEVLLGYLDAAAYPPDKYSYLFMVAEGTVFGRGTKMLAFFQPDPEEPHTEIRLTDSSAALDYSVDLTSLVPIAIPPGTPDIVFDWTDEDSALGTNAMGAEWVPNRITDVKIAHYRSLEIADLEDRFVDMELSADEMWTAFLSAGQRVNLAKLTNEAGEAFAGVDDTGTWVVSLICGRCSHPAPWFLSVLRPCAEE